MENKYDFAVSLAKESGKRLLEARGRYIEINFKNGDENDLVTNADTEVSEFIVEKIKEIFPGSHVYSEEAPVDLSAETEFWSVDPIDGTSNFARGIPHYAVAITYFEKGEPSIGAIYNPVTDEMFSFDKEKGSFLNNAPIHVSEISELKDAYVLLHIGRKEAVREWGLNLQKSFLGLVKKNINLGSSALDLAFLAAGRVDAVIYGTMTTMDIACATALVRSAGGEVYSLEGQPIEFLTTPQQMVATSNKILFERIQAL